MTHVKSTMSKQARMARAVGMDGLSPIAKYTRNLSSKEKLICRHMAHKGATLKEMSEAINWNLSQTSLYNKLNAINIKTKKSLSNYLHRD